MKPEDIKAELYELKKAISRLVEKTEAELVKELEAPQADEWPMREAVKKQAIAKAIERYTHDWGSGRLKQIFEELYDTAFRYGESIGAEEGHAEAERQYYEGSGW